MSKYLALRRTGRSRRWIGPPSRGGLARGRQLAVRLRHVGEVATRQLDRLLVGARQHVAAAGKPAVHERAASGLERRFSADRISTMRGLPRRGMPCLDHDHDW